jgi:hypothetical protein
MNPTLGTVARTRLLLNEAVFAWCVRQARACLRRRNLEDVLRWSLLAAKSAVHHPFGWLASRELEAILLRAARAVPTPRHAEVSRHGGPTHWLHVLDTAYQIGGHTILVRRWIECDSGSNRHSVALLTQPGPVPPLLAEAVRQSGGSLELFPPGAPMVAQAARLRHLAWTRADRVVLHIHPYSVIPAVAFGVAGGPPVMLLNHLSQKFWVGGSVADLVLNLRGSALEWSRAYRGIPRNAILPIPISAPGDGRAGSMSPETRRAARHALGLPLDAVILLTIGHQYKYRPLPGLDFLDAVAGVLGACPRALVVAVGPHEDTRWAAVREATAGRLRAVGPQSDLTPFHAAADVYLEGFPVGSPTALLEAGLSGIPCVRAPQCVPFPFSADDVALAGVGVPVDIPDYVRAAIALAESEPTRLVEGSALAATIRAHHAPGAWQRYLHAAKTALPEHHRVYPALGAATLPAHARDFSVALSIPGHVENTLAYTVQAAQKLSLRVRLDFSLARALARQWLLSDRAPLRRPRTVSVLVESVTGRRLADGLRGARRRMARLTSRGVRHRL